MQPHGVLLAAPASGRVLVASSNAADLLGVAVGEVLRRGLADLLGGEQVTAVPRART